MANLKDYATGTVAAPPSPALSGTSFTVQTGEGARYPATPFNATAHPADEMPTLNNAEKILVTNITSNTLTVTRAQGDTTAKNIAAGWRISNSLFVGDFINSSDLIDEDSMATNSASKVPSQQSVKAYADAREVAADAYADSIVAAAKAALFPVGSIYTNAGVSTNPATLLGFGTWTAFGAGRVMVGFDSGQTEFDTPEETGGAKTHTLTTAEMPSHTHGVGTLNRLGNVGNVVNGATSFDDWPGSSGPISATNAIVGHSWTGSLANEGGGGAHNNLQPYIVVYMWKRTA